MACVPGPCVWTVYPNMNVPGGVPRRELTLSACQEACIQTLYCLGVDIDTDPESAFCWLTVPPAAGELIQSFVGVTHYLLTRNEGCLYAGASAVDPSFLQPIHVYNDDCASTTPTSSLESPLSLSMNLFQCRLETYLFLKSFLP